MKAFLLVCWIPPFFLNACLTFTLLVVSELRDALKERGLPTEGLKGDLVNRLEEYLEEQEFALPDADGVPPTPTGSAKATVEEPPVPAPALEEAVEEPKDEAVPPAKEEAAKEVTPSVAELEKETATPGTEPSPAPVVPEPTSAAAAAEPAAAADEAVSEMSFAEKKAARAARFGIAVVEPKKPQTTPNKKRQNDKKQQGGSNKKQKKQQQKQQTPQKKNTPQKKEKPLLPVEEIEKRLKRAEKFGTGDNAQTQELKAMLRKHRFAAST